MALFQLNYLFKDYFHIQSHSEVLGLGLQCMSFGENTIQPMTAGLQQSHPC